MVVMDIAELSRGQFNQLGTPAASNQPQCNHAALAQPTDMYPNGSPGTGTHSPRMGILPDSHVRLGSNSSNKPPQK